MPEDRPITGVRRKALAKKAKTVPEAPRGAEEKKRKRKERAVPEEGSPSAVPAAPEFAAEDEIFKVFNEFTDRFVIDSMLAEGGIAARRVHAGRLAAQISCYLRHYAGQEEGFVKEIRTLEGQVRRLSDTNESLKLAAEAAEAAREELGRKIEEEKEKAAKEAVEAFRNSAEFRKIKDEVATDTYLEAMMDLTGRLKNRHPEWDVAFLEETSDTETRAAG